MKGFRRIIGGEKRIFAGKRNLRKEPFCPFVTNETGFHDFLRCAAKTPRTPIQSP
jgi:hypothetical protein